MLPPFPPSPPEGPPRGTYFSRRKATQPLPPWPAFTNILASSTNTAKNSRKVDRYAVACQKDNISGLSQPENPDWRLQNDVPPAQSLCVVTLQPRSGAGCGRLHALFPANAIASQRAPRARCAHDFRRAWRFGLLGRNGKNLQQLFVWHDGRERPRQTSCGRLAECHR